MGVIEIIGGLLLIIASVIIIVTVMLQDTKGGLGTAVSGQTNSFFDKNSKGRTFEAMLSRATIFGGVVLFLATLLVTIIVG